MIDKNAPTLAIAGWPVMLSCQFTRQREFGGSARLAEKEEKERDQALGHNKSRE
jgi:hypothetical protein